MEYGNGIMGDMCVHMLDTTRFMLGLGWPKRISSNGGIFVEKGGKSNISDTQTALFEYDGLNVTWQHRTWGQAADTKYPWSLILYGDKGTLKASVDGYDFTPEGGGKPIHKDAVFEREQFPEDVTEKEIDLSVRAGDAGEHEELFGMHRQPRAADLRYRSGAHLDRLLHPGQSLDAARPRDRLRSGEAPSRRRPRGDKAAPAAVPRAVEASGGFAGIVRS